MNTVRTTVILNASLHRQLSLQATMMGVGLSDIVNRKLANQNVGVSASSTANKIAKNLMLFRALAKKTGKTDWTKLVREERDRDDR